VKVELTSPVSDERTMVKNGILRVGPNEAGTLTLTASLYSGDDAVTGTKSLTKSESSTASYDRWPGLAVPPAESGDSSGSGSTESPTTP